MIAIWAIFITANVLHMTTEVILLEKFQQLSGPSRELALRFIEFLLHETPKAAQPIITPFVNQRNGFGSWKGIQLSANFDAPLEDFNDYMA